MNQKLTCKNSIIYVFDAHLKPVASIQSGDVIEIETYDCFENQIDEHRSLQGVDWNRVNPATGPIAIEGAQVGDVLKIQIEKIEIGEQGVLVAGPKLGMLGDHLTEMAQKIVSIQNNEVIFNEKMKFPIAPMIGVIGVAPAGEVIPTGIPGAHGGNLDTTLMKVGTVLYLPVFVDEALLAVGDLHAAMGDGEIGASGVEIGGCVTLKVDLLKQNTLKYVIKAPVLETNEHVVFLSSDESLAQAVKAATTEAAFYTRHRTGLSLGEATMLLSATGDVGVCQVVNPKVTARFAIPKSLFDGYVDNVSSVL